MKNVCRAATWVTLLALGLAVGQPTTVPPTPPAAKPGGVSTRTLAPQAMKLSANGQYVRVYPKDALKPFDSTDFFAERGLTVTKVEYDKNTQELLVSVEYGWANADEDRFRATIVEKFREAGRPVEPKAITVNPLEWVALSLVIRDGNSEYVAYATKNVSNVAAQTIAFRVPMLTGAESLHQRLANPKTMASVQLVLRAGYAFDKIAGLTVERKAINSAWQRVMESVFPNDPTKQAGPLYLDRNAEQLVYAKLKAEVSLVVRSYGLNAADEAEALKTVLAQLDKLTTPAAPMTVADLLDLNEKSVVLTVSAGKIEAQPATDDLMRTKFTEMKSSSEEVSRTAEAISDIATKHSKDERKFHSEARQLVIDGGAIALILRTPA